MQTITAPRRPWATAGLIALTIALAACGGDDKTGTSDGSSSGDATGNQPPSAQILSPTDGTELGPEDSFTLSGQIADDHDTPSDLRVSWRSNLVSGALGTSTPTPEGHVTLEVPRLVVGTHTITLEVTDSAGAVGVDSFTLVINGPPSAPTVAIDPTEPTTDDPLVVRITQGAIDPNTGSNGLTYRYVWLKNDVVTQLHGDTVPASETTRGDRWEVHVSASDGVLEGDFGAATATIGNAAPSCPTATLFPSAGTTLSTLTCGCAGFQDADGDKASSTCAFYDGTTPLGDGDGSCTLSPGIAKRGMDVHCTLTPGDGTATGAPVDSASVSILNAAPSAPTATLTPASGTAADSFVCGTGTASTDPDGDSLTYTVSWFVGTYEDPAAHAGVVLASDLQRDLAGHHPVKGDAIHCRVKASDGIATSAPGDSPAVTLGNSTPTLDNVFVKTVDGELADAASTLVCEVSGYADLDGDTVTLAFVWRVNGAVVTGATTKNLSGAFARGDTVACSVTATDGTATSPQKDSKTTLKIANAIPTLVDVTTSPGTTSAGGGVVTCSYSGWSDADGDAPEVVYDWYADGTAIPGEHGATFDTAGLAPGVEVTCSATPKNGSDLGATVASSNGTLITNSTPTLSSASLGPTDATVGATLTCTPVGFNDADGDTAVYTYAWTNNGQPIGGQTGATLAIALAKNDKIRCSVTPGDGHAQGTAVLSNEVVIKNTVPTITGVHVDPAGGSTCRAYTCVPDGARDADSGDVVAYAWRWLRSGSDVAGQTTATYGGPLAAGDTLACAARPTDGTTESAAVVYGVEKVSTAVPIADAAPTVSSVSVTPASPGVGVVVTCAPTGFADDCATTAAYTYQWYLNGTLVTGQAGATYDTAALNQGDQVRCSATPTDGKQNGTAVSSPTVSMGPGTPTAARVSVSAPSGAGGNATCVIDTPARWLTSPTYTFYWRVNGGAEVQGSATLSGLHDCDLLSCRAVATSGQTSLSSDPASLLLPVGASCDDGNQCTLASCKVGGGCQNTVTDGAACNDGNPCTTGDKCGGSTCLGTGSAASTVTCDDGQFCTTADHCDGAGKCTGGGPSCVAAADGCKNASCDENLDQCVFTNKDNGSTCDADGSGCTVGDSCTSGVCIAGAPATCASDDCNTGTCTSTGKKTYTCGKTPKDQGTTCTGPDYCVTGMTCDGAGSCTGGVDRDCAAQIGDPCFDAFCDSVARECVPFANPDGTACDDGTDCTLVDQCKNGLCKGAQDVCVEERADSLVGVSAGNTQAQPGLGHLGFGRYALSFPTFTGTGSQVRITAPHDSREASELHANGVTGWPYGALSESTGIAVRSDGAFGLPVYSASNYSAGNGTSTSYYVIGASFDAVGTLSPYRQLISGTYIASATNNLRVRAVPLVSGTGGYSMLYALSVTGSGNPATDTIHWYPSTSTGTDWAVGTAKQLVSGVDAEDFDGVTDPDGGLVLAFAKAGTLTVRAVGSDGSTLGTDTTVATALSGTSISQVRMENRIGGGFVVAWAETPASGSTVLKVAMLDAARAVTVPAVVVDEQPVGSQWLGDVATFSDGGFVVVYDSSAGDVDGYGIRARLFDELGVAEGPEVAINSLTAGNQRHPSVVALPDDEWVVAWHDDKGSVSAAYGDTYTKRFTRNGDPQPGRFERLVNETTTGAQKAAQAAKAANGSVLVAWEGPVTGQVGTDIWGRLYDSLGAPLGHELVLNTTTSGSQVGVKVGGGPDRFFVAWQHASGEVRARILTSTLTEVKAEFVATKGTSMTLKALAMNRYGETLIVYTTALAKPQYRIFDKDGTVIADETLIIDVALSYFDVAADPVSGIFVVGYAPAPNLYATRISRTGTVLTTGTLVSSSQPAQQPFQPAIAINNAGTTIAFCWAQYAGAGYQQCRFMKNDATLTALTTETQVSQTRAGTGSFTPDVAFLPTNQLLIAFAENGAREDNFGIVAQKVAVDGSTVGNSFVVNRTWPGNQEAPFVVPTLGTTVLVGWDSPGQDGNLDGLYLRALPSN